MAKAQVDFNVTPKAVKETDLELANSDFVTLEHYLATEAL